MADDDWIMGELARQDNYEAMPASTNIDDRRPTNLHEFSGNEPVIVPGYMRPARGWGDLIDQSALQMDAGRDRTFGHDPHGFKAAIDNPPPQAFPHPLQASTADQFEGRLARKESLDELDRIVDRAFRQNPPPQWAQRDLPQRTQAELDAAYEELLRNAPPVDPRAGRPTNDEQSVMAGRPPIQGPPAPSPYPPPGQPWPTPRGKPGPIMPPLPWLPPDWRN